MRFSFFFERCEAVGHAVVNVLGINYLITISLVMYFFTSIAFSCILNNNIIICLRCTNE